MSEASEQASVFMVMADHIGVDGAGKVNLLGANIQLIGHDASSGMTNPFGLLVLLTFPTSQVGESPAVEVVLEDAAGEPVRLPSFGGPAAEPQLMRVGAAQQLEEPTFSQQGIPRQIIKPRAQMLLSFGNGLPLAIGQAYTWRVRIDHETRDAWTETFYVPGPIAPPVLG